MIPHSPPVRVHIDELGVVSTMVNGKGPFHFVLDTGAGITVLSQDFAKRAGIIGHGAGTATGVGGTTAMQTVTLDEMRVGDADLHKVAAAIIPLPLDLTYQGHYGTIDGLVGYSFLSHFATTIDLVSQTVTFAAPEDYVSPPAATSIAATFPGNCPLVPANANGHRGTFQIDTGDNGYLTLTGPFAARYDVLAQNGGRGFDVLAQGVGGSVSATEVRLKQFTLGATTLTDELTSVSHAMAGILSESDLAGNIGTRVLRRFIFTVDYVHKRVDFIPSSLVNAHDPYRPTGLQITREPNGTFRIVGVIDKTPAADASVKAGETLVSINGQDVRQLTSVETSAGLAADTVTLGIESDGQTRTVVLHPREVLPEG